MNIQKKIQEIRKQPEHVRLKYAWGMTFISFFVVVVIWLISISAQNETPKDEETLKNQQEIINEFQEQKKALTDTAGGIKDVLDDASSMEKEMKFQDEAKKESVDKEF